MAQVDGDLRFDEPDRAQPPVGVGRAVMENKALGFRLEFITRDDLIPGTRLYICMDCGSLVTGTFGHARHHAGLAS